MLDLRHAYYTLLGSAAQLALCRRAHSVADLLAVLRRLWDTDGLGDAPLLQAIGALNHEDVPDEVAVGLAGLWLPHSYHVRSQRMRWCLPDGAPTEPFHDEYLSRCWRSATLNQLFSPRTSLKALAACAQRVPRAQPAGFIFHLSRCGSTLLSGCLSELDEAAVFSESPVLTEVLVDPALTPQEKRAHVQCLIDLKAVLFPGRRVVVKWNAWDIFHAQLLRGAYPAVPAVALVRDPVEILASHHARAGRHMSGDPSLAGVAPVFGVSAGGSVLEHRIGVLQRLMESMQALAVEPDNPELTPYIAQCEALRARGQPTLPAVLMTERRINPFLRSREATVLRAVRAHAGLAANAAEPEVFAALRQWKNDFR